MSTIPSLLADQSLPARNLSRLSLTGHTAASLQAWVDNLPIMNAPETGKKLYQTLQELAALNVSEDARFELTEILEPAVFNLISTLNKQLENQPVQLPPPAQRITLLVQYLHQQLALCYKVAAVETLRKLQGGKVGFLNLGKRGARQLAATALQRELSELTRLLHDVYHVYRPVPAGVWQDIHTIFEIAEALDLLDVAVRDRHSLYLTETSLRRSYLRAVMLGASQTQKLRLPEISQLYVESETWTSHLTVTRGGAGVVVCKREDAPPQFRQRSVSTATSWQVQGEELVKHLQALTNNPGKLAISLLNHLVEIWRRGRERMFDRKACDKPILVGLGLSAAHFYLAGQRDFQTIVKGNEEEVVVAQPAFLFGLEEDKVPEEHPDAWQLSYQSVETRETPDDEPDTREKRPVTTFTPFRVQAFNASPGGYGVAWPKPPKAFRPGEIVAICEERGKNWNLGILHWVRLGAEQRVEAGLELLSAEAKPCGVRVVKSAVEDSEALRGFLVPEMKILEQPATLITPSASFAVGADIKICLTGQEVRARLTRLVLATPSICQYEFALHATGTPAAAAAPAPDEDIDAMWAQLRS